MTGPLLRRRRRGGYSQKSWHATAGPGQASRRPWRYGDHRRDPTGAWPFRMTGTAPFPSSRPSVRTMTPPSLRATSIRRWRVSALVALLVAGASYWCFRDFPKTASDRTGALELVTYVDTAPNPGPSYGLHAGSLKLTVRLVMRNLTGDTIVYRPEGRALGEVRLTKKGNHPQELATRPMKFAAHEFVMRRHEADSVGPPDVILMPYEARPTRTYHLFIGYSRNPEWYNVATAFEAQTSRGERRAISSTVEFQVPRRTFHESPRPAGLLPD